MVGVTVYSPQLSVVVKKVIRRRATVAEGVAVSNRVSTAANQIDWADPTAGPEIDLTPYLAVGVPVRVNRSVSGPDSGKFSIVIPDQENVDLADSIYGLVEPMDVIEIRMARDPQAGGELPIVLRGFISSVSRSESMTEGGPQRRVVISGQDYSKILNLIRFIYLPTMIPAQLLLTSFSLFMNYGAESTGSETPAEFVIKIVNEVVGEFIGKMQAGSGGKASPVQLITPFAVDTSAPATVQPFGVQAWEGGDVYSLLATFGDVGAWNELYVEDRDEGPVLVYRPTPYKNALGDYIQSGAGADEVEATAEDVLMISVERTDRNVANYYWVDAPRLNLVEDVLTRLDQQIAPSPALDGYQNADPFFYGIRLMREATNQGPRYDGKPEAGVEEGEGIVIEQVAEKRRVLIENNKDNSVFEAGSIMMKGSPKFRAGTYLNLDRGGFKASYYIAEVDHEFVVGVSYHTTLTVERGTGFIERLKRGAGNSAYLAELTAGGTYA